MCFIEISHSPSNSAANFQMCFVLNEANIYMCQVHLAQYFLVAQMVKNLPAIRKLGFDPWVGKIPLEKGMATHASILAWRITWTEEPGAPHSVGLQRVGHD